METVSVAQCLKHQRARESHNDLIKLQILTHQFWSQNPTFLASSQVIQMLHILNYTSSNQALDAQPFEDGGHKVAHLALYGGKQVGERQACGEPLPDTLLQPQAYQPYFKQLKS